MVVRVIPIRLVRSLASLGAAVALLGGVAPAGAATVDFDGFSGGTLLTTQLEGSLGIRFPEGVEVVETARSLSSPNVARPQLDGEFRRDAFEARFSSGQVSVSLWVRADEDPDPPVDVEYTLSAFDDSGFPVSSDSVTVSTDSGWHQLAVSDLSSDESIRRIILTGRRTGSSSNTNFLIVDDLTFEGAEPPPPSDDTPPDVLILEPPFFVTISNNFIDVRVEAEDDESLLSVAGDIVHLDSGTEVGVLDFCGSTFSGPCPDGTLDETATVPLDPAIEGDHRITVMACDSADNCATDTQGFELELSEPPSEVEVRTRVLELNQGVQSSSGVQEVFGPGTVDEYVTSVLRVEGKDLVVRVYPFGVDGDRRDYTAQLRVRITYEDGSELARRIDPNAGASTVDVVEEPSSTSERRDELRRMRIDLERTLNYVVPAQFLDDVEQLELQVVENEGPGLRTPKTARVRTHLSTAAHLGVQRVRLFGPGIPSGTRPTEAQIEDAYEYVREAYPMAEVTEISRSSYPILKEVFCRLFSSKLSCALWQFRKHDPPGGIDDIGDPGRLVKLGVVPYGSFGRVGIAKRKNPSSSKRGRGIAMAWGDMAFAHEIGHTIGLKHASKAHGEGGGGSAEGDWPYAHGSIGLQNFGVITQESTPPGDFDFGQWDVRLVDPCPGVRLSRRSARCENLFLEGPTTHDFMSYGPSGAADLGHVDATAARNHWISDLNWNRIYRAIAFRSNPYGLAGRQGGEETVDALLIDGVLQEDGSIAPLPVLRKNVRPEELEAEPGPYTLQLFDAEGALLLERTFDLTELAEQDVEDAQFDRIVDQSVPYTPELHRIVVRHEGETLLDRSASPSPPEVTLLAPAGGESIPSGEVTVRWTARDADGDDLLFTVAYSPDDGATWQTLGMAGDEGPLEHRVPVAEVSEPSRRARFRVVASDGLLTSTVVSECPLAVGTDEPPVECDQAAPEPPREEFLTDPAFPDFGFQVRITAGDTVLFGSREPDCLPETLCVSGDLEGRSEIFVRIVGPKPNGKLWPNLVKFSTSTVEVWVQQTSTGVVKYYELAGATPGSSELPGLFDRDGFDPQGASGGLQVSERSAERPAEGLTERLAERSGLDPRAGEAPSPPPGEFLTSDRFPDFRFKVRITAGDEVQDHRKEPLCIDETVCVSGALPGRSELFLRIVGPKPNGKLWPTLVKFSTSQVEVWIEQISTGVTKYYVLEGASPGSSDLTGLFDREGFEP